MNRKERQLTAQQTESSKPVYGNVADNRTEEEADRPPSHHFSGVPAGQLSPAGDEPPLVRSRLSEDGAETSEDTLSPTGGVAGSRVEPS